MAGSGKCGACRRSGALCSSGSFARMRYSAWTVVKILQFTEWNLQPKPRGLLQGQPPTLPIPEPGQVSQSVSPWVAGGPLAEVSYNLHHRESRNAKRSGLLRRSWGCWRAWRGEAQGPRTASFTTQAAGSSGHRPAGLPPLRPSSLTRLAVQRRQTAAPLLPDPDPAVAPLLQSPRHGPDPAVFPTLT